MRLNGELKWGSAVLVVWCDVMWCGVVCGVVGDNRREFEQDKKEDFDRKIRVR